MINLRPLGNTGIMVSPVGLGCWQFSKQQNIAGKFWSMVDEEDIDNIVLVSLKGGMNFFDTAEAYGKGASERALSHALQMAGIKPGEVTVATKWWPAFRFASAMGKTIGERMDALAPYPIDLYQIHQPFGFSGVKAEMSAMAELLRKKLIRNIGVSNFSANIMKIAWEKLQKKGLSLASNQLRYSLLDRRIESNGIMATAKKLGISIIAYSPLAQGLLTGKFHDNPELLAKIGLRKYTPGFGARALEKSRPLITLVKNLARKYDVTPAQVALNWIIHYHGDIVIAIPGATMIAQARENTGAMSFRLSEDDMVKLDRASAVFK